jgi:hypothetical protein
VEAYRKRFILWDSFCTRFESGGEGTWRTRVGTEEKSDAVFGLTAETKLGWGISAGRNVKYTVDKIIPFVCDTNTVRWDTNTVRWRSIQYYRSIGWSSGRDSREKSWQPIDTNKYNHLFVELFVEFLHLGILYRTSVDIVTSRT